MPDGTRQILNILAKLENSKTPTIFLSLDAENAFARIHWDFIIKTLSKFGFHGNIVSTIQAQYSSPSA